MILLCYLIWMVIIISNMCISSVGIKNIIDNSINLPRTNNSPNTIGISKLTCSRQHKFMDYI